MSCIPHDNISSRLSSARNGGFTCNHTIVEIDFPSTKTILHSTARCSIRKAKSDRSFLMTPDVTFGL